MSFERFVQKGTTIYNKTFARITKNNTLALNAKAIRLYAIHQYPFINIYYEEETQKVGLELLQDSQENCYKLSIASNLCTVYMSFTNFLKYYNLELNKARKYLVTKDEESGLLVFDISKPLNVLTYKKKKTSNMKGLPIHK